MNEFISVVLGAIKSVWGFLTSAVSNVMDYYKSEKELQEVRAQQLQQQQAIQNIYCYMYNLSYDLFYVLQGKRYYFLRPITAASSIRAVGWSTSNKQYTYVYELSKTVLQTVPAPILGQVMNDINADIILAQNYLASIYGTQAFAAAYPFLRNGTVKVTGILDTGTAIRISVIA